MNRATAARLYEPGVRARVHEDGHAEKSIAAVKGNCGQLSVDQRDGLFDACNKVLREEGRPEIARSTFDGLVR